MTQRETEGQGALTLHELARLLRHESKAIGVVVVACVLASVALLAVREPVYRATASLALDDEHSGAGILGELAMLARPPKALAEIEVLRSRTLAERVLAAPPDGGLAHDAAPHELRSLGLATIVDDEGLAPLAALTSSSRAPREPRAGDARLFATLEASTVGAPSDVPDELRVEFLAADRVRLSVPGLVARWRGQAVEPVEVAYAPRARIDYAGLALQLEAQGDLAGRSFRVRAFTPARALERLMESTRATETARNSGVIEVSVDDTDPWRAADTANALCVNYLERNKTRGEKRASQTLQFIDAQLTEQVSSLDVAEREVVALQERSPATIDVSKTAEAWIEQLKEFELERVQLKLARTALAEAVSLLEAGHVEAMARLSNELADPISVAYVEQIVGLQAELALQGRSNTGAFKTILQSKAAELRLEADALEIEIAGVEQALTEIGRGDDGACARLAAVDARGRGGDPLSAAYAAQLAAGTAHLRELSKAFTDEHPEVVAARRAVDDARARLVGIGASRLAGLEAQREQFARLLDGYAARLDGEPSAERGKIESALREVEARTRTHLRSRLGGVAQRAEDLAREIGLVEERLATLPDAERMLADPKRRLAAHAEIVKFLLTRQQEAQITRASTVATAEFIDLAAPPRERHAPSLWMHLVLGLMAGMCLGLGLAYARQTFDAGVLSSAELETATGLPVFGAIPDFRNGRYKVAGATEHFLALRDDPDGPIAEAYRSLRANLKFALSADESIRVIAFTSSSQGEGKSVTNIDIALSFALNEKRVLLVDADMRRPVVHKYFGLERTPGLAEILAGRADWNECVQETGFERLHVISAGKQPGSPGDLLSSRACDEFLAAARQAYDLIVFDVPPALAVADTENFAAKLDGMVLLCRANKLTHVVLERTTERLKRAGAKLIGAVLNAERPTRTESRYGYGYGYGYGLERSRTKRGASEREREREHAGSDR